MDARRRRLFLKAGVLKALADPVRLDIMELLRGGEKCVCEIVASTNVAQPLVSRHLKILKERGIIRSRNEKNRRYYFITDDRVCRVLDCLDREVLTALSKAIAHHSSITVAEEIYS